MCTSEELGGGETMTDHNTVLMTSMITTTTLIHVFEKIYTSSMEIKCHLVSFTTHTHTHTPVAVSCTPLSGGWVSAICLFTGCVWWIWHPQMINWGQTQLIKRIKFGPTASVLHEHQSLLMQGPKVDTFTDWQTVRSGFPLGFTAVKSEVPSAQR